MPRNNFLGPRWSEAGLKELLRQAQGLIRQFDELADEVDGYLRIGEDMRAVDGELAERLAEARGMPVNRRRFNRAFAEQTRDEFIRILDVAYQNRVAARR